MKKILLIAILFFILFSCSTEIEPVDSDIIAKPLTYCDIVLVSGEAWSDNANVWKRIKVADSQSLIELELLHVGGDVTEFMRASFRKDALHREYTASSFYNGVKGTVIMTTDAAGFIEWRNDWAADEARKINFIIKLIMY